MVHVEYIDGTTEDIETPGFFEEFGYTFDKISNMFYIEQSTSGNNIMIPKEFVKSIRTIPV